MYNAGAGVIEIGANATETSNAIIDFIFQYWTWIVPAIMLVGGLVAIFVIGINHPAVIIAAIVGFILLVIQMGAMFL